MHVGLVVEQLRRRVPGGIGTYTRGLIKGLAEMGPGAPELTLLASRSPASAALQARDPLESLGLALRCSALPSRLLSGAWVTGLPAGLLGLSLGGLDVVHAVSLGGPATGAIPSVTCVHDLAWRALPAAFPPRGRRWHEAALARALARSSRFVVPSSETASALVDAGAKPGTVVVVEEGCDHLEAVDAGATTAVLDALGVEGPYLLCVGTLEPRKNLARLVAAYGAAQARFPKPWPLVVVGAAGWGGTGTPPGHISADRVLFAGAVSPGALAGLYAGARCVAYVPLLEGWGLPAVEAMAMGVPVVASPMPSTAGQALEVDPLDESAIADALVLAACDEDTRSGLVARGQARAAALTWAATARAHVAIWEEVA